jgi:Ca2+-binding RTX toxin-like protein
MPFSYTVNSSKQGVTKDSVRNSHGNLHKESNKNKSTNEAILKEGKNVEIYVDDGNDPELYGNNKPNATSEDVGPKMWTKQSWENDQITKHPNDPQKRRSWPFDPDSDAVIAIPTTAIDGEYYNDPTMSGPPIKLSLERVLAHELEHVRQHVEEGPTTNTNRNEREHQAVAAENETMSELPEPYKEPENLREVDIDPYNVANVEEPLTPNNPIDPVIKNPEPAIPVTPQHVLKPFDTPLPQFLDDLLNYWDDALANNSPLVLDLDGNGIDLAAVTGSGAVYWDIDEDGFSEASGWISGNDGLLAIDLNGDGIINDHSELFGDDTTDGFTVLSSYDSNSDNVIDSNDTQFNDLLVWVDANSNGVSESTELSTLSDLNITSINLNASLVDYDIAGNHITHESTFTINGQTQTIVDAWFSFDNTNSVYTDDYELHDMVFFLPSLRGFGDVKHLHIAMSQDSSLLDMVENIAFLDAPTLLDPSFDLLGNVEDIMFRWAGVDGVDPSTRGTVNAQQLEFLEAYFGQPYVHPVTGWTDPTAGGVNDVHELFAKVLSQITASLLAQTDAAPYLGENANYNLVTGELEGAENIDTFFLLENNSTVDATSGNDVFSFFGDVGTVNVQTVTNAGYDQVWIGSDSTDARYWVDNGGELHIRASETSLNELILHGDVYYPNGADIANRFEKIVFSDGVELDLSQGLNQLDTDDAHTLYGASLDDTINGRGGNDNISGFAGNDHLIGGAGADTLYGGDGNDIIEGGTDADTLQGELGDDSYVWSVGDGNDTINESGGTDQLVIHGVMENELRFVVQYPYNLNIVIDTETIVISQQIASDYTGNSYYDTYQVESLLLDDGTVIDLLNNMTFTGTSAGEYLYGTKTDNALYGLDGADYLYASDGNDTLYGGVGADNLNGELGNDTYVWSIGDGNDTITDTGGTDKILFGAGITENDISFSRYSSYDFKITIGSEEILLSGHYLANKAIETAVLDDGIIIDLLNNVTFTGTSGSDYMWGLSSGDTLKGLAGSDWLYGDGGDDVLIGGEGADMLYGQGGADIFLFDDLASSDNIQDFDLTAGDKLDVSDLLIGYDPLTDAITDFVQITESGGSSYLNVDADGGADNFVQVAYIYNATGLTDEDALETSGNLIAA